MNLDKKLMGIWTTKNEQKKQGINKRFGYKQD